MLVCTSCVKPQSGVVRLEWSDGAVTYACKHCGTFNELREIRVTRRPRYAQRAPTTSRPRTEPAPH
jgi:hypothetical protein